MHAQLEVTEAIVDELLDGDMRALYPLLVADTRAGIGGVTHMLVRTMGPARALRMAPRTFHKVHERGRVDIEVDGREALLTFTGTPLFAHPTWRLLQLFATSVMLELADKPGHVTGVNGGSDSFVARASW